MKSIEYNVLMDIESSPIHSFNNNIALPESEQKRKPNGYWDKEENIVKELKLIVNQLCHFPTHKELASLNRSSLSVYIAIHGGTNKFRGLLGFGITQKPHGYWNDETIIKELKEAINNIGHFPTHNELAIINTGIGAQILRNGGINKFRELLGYPIEKRNAGYWTDKAVIDELKPILNTIGYFPTHEELTEMGHCDLVGGMVRCGGSNKFRNLLNYPIDHREHGYWSDDTIIEELKRIVDKIGHFPDQAELNKMGMSSISNAIKRQYKNINTYRSFLEIPIVRKSNGFWSDRIITEELTKVINEIGHFPSRNDLINIKNTDLLGAVERYGGYNKFRKLLGYNISLYEQYRSESASYTFRRGRHSENFVKNIITEWTKEHNLPEPKYNVKLAQGNVIEFVCDINKRIGIDVTNTATSYAITKKWRKKDYHKHLDELWIVVFSDSFTNMEYVNWNNSSPYNVKIMSIEVFLKELDYSLDEYTKDKINKLKKCTFRNKEQIMNDNLSNKDG